MSQLVVRRPKVLLPGLLLLVFLVMCLSACGSSERFLGSAKVERAIALSIKNERGVSTLVACPAKVPLEAGRVFTCSAHLEVGAYPVSVTETNDSGEVRYEDRQSLVVLNVAKVQSAIEASISSERHVTASVLCPAEVLQRAGIAFRCTAVIDGSTRRYPFAVDEVDNAGHVRYVGT